MKSIVLSSGGVDSTTCVALAVERFGSENVSTLSVFYGQRHSKELECAQKIADYYGLRHYEIDLSQIMRYSSCSLLEGREEHPIHQSYEEQLRDGGRVTTYVPFRNGLFLSSVAALAVSIYPDDEVIVYIGAHADDAAGNAYADCSEEFLSHMREAIRIGTYEKVIVEYPFAGLPKKEVVREGLRMNVPYELTWSCYEGEEFPCGECGTCRDRIAAFEANGVKDPIQYK